MFVFHVAPNVCADTRVIPSISLSEMYDSNVWFGFTPPGRPKFDYATSVSPQLTVEHRGRLFEGTFIGGPSANFYINNPDLNYVGATGIFNGNLDQLAQKLDRRLSLLVKDNFYYTNQLQPFINAPAGQDPTITGSSIGSGIQAFRVTSTANIGMATGSFLLTPSTVFQATYANSLIRFGGTFSDQTQVGDTVSNQTQVSAFGVTSHSLTAGPLWRITPRDTVGANYTYSTADFEISGLPGGGRFSTQGGSLTWSRLLTPTLTANVQGGIQVLDSGDTPVGPGQVGGQASNLLYVTSTSLTWRYDDNSLLTLSYSRSVVPSFFVVPVPLVSNVVSASFSQQLSEKVSATESANYAHSEDEASILSFVSYSGTVSLNYAISRSLTAMAMYTYFNLEYIDSSSGSAVRFAFDRSLITVSLKASWN